MQNSAKNFSQQRLKNILNAAFIAFKCQKLPILSFKWGL